MLACTSFGGARSHLIDYLVKLSTGGLVAPFGSYLVSLVGALFGFRADLQLVLCLVLRTGNFLSHLFLTQGGLLLATGLLLKLRVAILLSHAFRGDLVQAIQVRVCMLITWGHCASRLLRSIEQHVVWNTDLGSRTRDDMPPRR